MAKFLVTFSDSINEIEVNGFVVMTNKEVETYEQLANDISWPFVIDYNGYDIDYNDGEELLSRMEFKEISLEENKSIKRIFNNEFGFFVSENLLLEVIGDEEDDDEFEDDYDGDSDDDDYNEY